MASKLECNSKLVSVSLDVSRSFVCLTQAVRDSREIVESVLKEDRTVYGINTGKCRTFSPRTMEKVESDRLRCAWPRQEGR
jgi:histidine ammonia-lyase